MSTIYVVTREGVYRHEIVCVSRSQEHARMVAEKAIRAESDDYHGYQVGKAELDAVEPFADIELVATVTRKDETAIENGFRVIKSFKIEWHEPKPAPPPPPPITPEQRAEKQKAEIARQKHKAAWRDRVDED